MRSTRSTFFFLATLSVSLFIALDMPPVTMGMDWLENNDTLLTPAWIAPNVTTNTSEYYEYDLLDIVLDADYYSFTVEPGDNVTITWAGYPPLGPFTLNFTLYDDTLAAVNSTTTYASNGTFNVSTLEYSFATLASPANATVLFDTNATVRYRFIIQVDKAPATPVISPTIPGFGTGWLLVIVTAVSAGFVVITLGKLRNKRGF